MSLPFSTSKDFFQKKNIEALILPAVVAIFLLGVLLLSIVVPQQREKEPDGKKAIGYYTDRQKVVSRDKTIEVSPKVLQISPEHLRQSLEAKENLKVIQILITGKESSEPHISSTIFMVPSAFDNIPSLERTDTHVFVSEDGYDSAVVIDKIVSMGFLPQTNLNLEGGLKAWKKKGFPLEN